MPRSALALLPLIALAGGCELVEDLATATITGKVNVDGETPDEYTFELYKFSDNQDAFDNSYCDEVGDDVEGDCYGRVKVGKLNSETKPGNIIVDGKNFTLEEVPTDLGYVLVVSGKGDGLSCTSDVLGYDPENKVVTSESAIAIDPDGGLDNFAAPEPARINCSSTEGEPEPPEEVDPPEPDNGGDDIPEPAVAEWSSFVVTDKSGTVLADASTSSVVSDVVCDSSFPPVVEVQGTLDNADADTAFLRMQFGSGDDAEFRTMEVPMDADGNVQQAVSLTGGYTVLQLDGDDTLDDQGESYTATFCDRQDPPAQELLLILSWDKDDTDVDLHVTSEDSEVAYYSLSQSWGDLDIDDIDGFGPETFTSTPGTNGRDYDVQVHYYSSHGNGDTNVTLRAVYVDPTGEVCDITTTRNMASYEWWDVARFGPGVPCPE